MVRTGFPVASVRTWLYSAITLTAASQVLPTSSVLVHVGSPPFGAWAVNRKMPLFVVSACDRLVAPMKEPSVPHGIMAVSSMAGDPVLPTA